MGRKVRATRINVTPATMPTNCGRWVGSVPTDSGVLPCAGKRSGQREHEDDRQEPAEHHRQAECGVVPNGVHADAREGRAVVVGRGGERVEHLRKAVRAGVEHACALAGHRHRDGGSCQHEQRGDQEVRCGELDLARSDLLAEVLRCAADHQAGDEHRDDRQDEHAVQAGADAARRDLAELHVEQRHHAAEAGVGVVERVHRTRRRQRRQIGEDRRVRHAEALLHTFHRRSHRGGNGSVSLDLERHHQRHADQRDAPT